MRAWGAQPWKRTLLLGQCVVLGPKSLTLHFSEFSDTIDHRNLKFGTLVVCDVGFPKMYIYISLSQRSKVIRGHNLCRKKHLFFSDIKMNVGMKLGIHLGDILTDLVCYIMFAHLPKVKGHQGP